ncbi:hypothetical protein [Bacteroides sedimenti]
MKFIKNVFPAVLMILLLSSFSFLGKGNKQKPVYAFGVSASFTDSIVYYTEIQQLDSVHLTKDGFLPKRDAYSAQLKLFLENRGEAGRTCMIYFSNSKKTINKEFDKITKRYKNKKSVSFQKITANDFQFKKPE